MSKTAHEAAEKLSEKAEALGKTDVYKTISKVLNMSFVVLEYKGHQFLYFCD